MRMNSESKFRISNDTAAVILLTAALAVHWITVGFWWRIAVQGWVESAQADWLSPTEKAVELITGIPDTIAFLAKIHAVEAPVSAAITAVLGALGIAVYVRPRWSP